MLNVPVRVLVYTLGPTAIALLLTAWVTGWHRRIGECRSDIRCRASALAPFVLALGAVLAFNGYVRPRVDEISPAFAINFTGQLFEVEGYFVAVLQNATPDLLVLYFIGVYVVGYAVLLIFPILAYTVLDDLRHAKIALTAYATNYFVGALLYIVFEVYGPRNLQVADGRLYDLYPELMYLTSSVNSNSNAFPSLHTSMSVTVLLLAFYSRTEYPWWLLISAVVAPSVVLSTMVLGIHWFADVVAGVVLALVSVSFARWLIPRIRDREEHDTEHRSIDQVRL